MNKIALLYCSVHHKNTEKLVSDHKNTDLYDLCRTDNVDLSAYDIVGFASGIYMSKLHGKLREFIQNNQHKLKHVFFVYTSGSGAKKYGKKIRAEWEKAGLNVLNIFSCKGFDTYGPWRLIGGIAKHHPDSKDLENYRSFIQNLREMQL